MQASNTRAEQESEARRAAQDAVADFEKEKTMKELEVQEMISRHTQELARADTSLASVRACLKFVEEKNVNALAVMCHISIVEIYYLSYYCFVEEFDVFVI